LKKNLTLKLTYRKKVSNTILIKLPKLIKENWGTFFIVIFMVLLIAATFSKSLKLNPLTDILAFLSYCGLIIGVILNFIYFIKYYNKNSKYVNV